MEFLVINENKLKIVLSRCDMDEYGIDANATSYETPATKQAFWRVLDEAKIKCGFSASGEKLLIQFYPSGEGSELFVTKLGRIGTSAEKSIARSHNVTMLSSKRTFYKIPDLALMLPAVRNLSETAKNISADLYYCDDSCYYLLFEERSAYAAVTELSFIGEYSSPVPCTLLPYIKEHSKRLSENGNALHILSQL